MFKTLIICSVALACAASSQVAEAQSLKEKKQAEEWNATAKEYQSSVKAACGKEIAVELDSASWKNRPAEHSEYNMGAYCNDGCQHGVKLICADSLGKTAVGEKIDKIVCRYHSSDQPKITLQAAEKTVVCEFNSNNMSFQDSTKQQLEEQL